MGTIRTLRPNGNISGTSNFTVTGAATVHGALSDQDNASYVFSGGGDRTAWLDVGSYTLGADELVKRLRVGVTVTFDHKPLFYAWGCESRWEPSVVQKVRQSKNSGWDTFYTAWVPAGDAANASGILSQADIDSLHLFIRDKASGLSNFWSEAWIELDVVDRPTVTVTAPSGVIAKSRPTVEWDYADGDGDAQTVFDARVFTAAQYGAGGFNPATSDAFWQSGEVESDAESITVDTVLPNGVYRAYVRVAHAGGYFPYWSAWDYEGFTVTLTAAPSTPTVAAVQDYADTEVEVTVSGSALPGGLSDGTVRLQRSIDEDTWVDVRLGYVHPSMAGSWSTTITDYEAPRDVEVFYRAQVTAYDTANESWSPSPWSSTDSLTPEMDDTWFAAVWVEGDLVETDGYSYLDGEWVVYTPVVEDEPIGETVEPGTESVLRPLGRVGAVVVSDDLSLGDGSVTLIATEDNADEMKALAHTREPVLLRQPLIAQKWVALVGARDWQIEPEISVVAVSYVGIDTPAVA